MPKCYIDNYTKQELEEIVASSKSMTEVAYKIGYASYAPSTQKIIRRTFTELGIPLIKKTTRDKLTDEEIFVKDSTASQHCLREHFKKITPPDHCSICGMEPEWQGKPLHLILDHIDGNHTNDEITNLRWVCPNCNSQLETTGFHKCRMDDIKDKCKYEKPKPRKDVKYIKATEAEYDNNRYLHKKCARCGKDITNYSTYCRECAEEVKRENRLMKLERFVSRDKLKDLVRENKLTEAENILSVSEHVIKRMLRNYKLPEHKTDIDSYSDEEWAKL